jgi:hypothetical protein
VKKAGRLFVDRFDSQFGFSSSALKTQRRIGDHCALDVAARHEAQQTAFLARYGNTYQPIVDHDGGDAPNVGDGFVSLDPSSRDG